VAATRDGYLFAGNDGYLIKTDLNGDPVWNLTLNATVLPWVLSVAADADGFAMTGCGRTQQSIYNQNILLVKIKSDAGSNSAVASPAPASSPLSAPMLAILSILITAILAVKRRK